jgi:acetyl esterase/lipase
MRTFVVLIMVLTGIVARPVFAAEVRTDLPSKIDAGSKYLFYLHGVSVELNGPDSYNQRFRKKYQTTAIARSLAERGFTVIAEARPKGASVPAYADKLASQVQQLLSASVPPRHIAVVGHSKGGFIALAAAGRIASPEVSFVLLASCPLTTTRDIAGSDARASFEAIIARNKGRLSGRILSLYDVTDGWMGSCREAFADNVGVVTKEIVLKTGLPPGQGHSLFFAPEKVWMDAVTRWIGE